MSFTTNDLTTVVTRQFAATLQTRTGRPVRCVLFKDHELDYAKNTGFLMRIIFEKNWGSRKVDGAGDMQVDSYAIDYPVYGFDLLTMALLAEDAVTEINRIVGGGTVEEHQEQYKDRADVNTKK